MRIKSIGEQEARGELAEIYAQARATSPLGIVPPIMQTMSLRADFLAAIRQAVNTLHFADGALTRAQHEMVVVCVGAEPLSLLTERAHLVPAVAARAVQRRCRGAP